MKIVIDPVPSGHAVSVSTPSGSIKAYIYPPREGADHQCFRICFGESSRAFAFLQGKVHDCKTLDSARMHIDMIADGRVTQKNGYISTSYGIRGHFAVLIGLKDNFESPQQTSIPSYATKNGAVVHGMSWAEAEGIPFCPA